MNYSVPFYHVFIFMGVSGSGKSTIANSVACRLHAAILDGDFLHPRDNIEKMSSGRALSDSDRRPWLQAINDAIFAMKRTNKLSLIVCSALKKSYRDILRMGHPSLSFIYLKGDFEIIQARLQKRKGHFFQSQMLRAQFLTLEDPGNDEKDICLVNVNQSLQCVIDTSIKTIENIIQYHTGGS
ncbi:Thermoresistant gluconokinase [Candidatus Erwinia haradaeae]|uniref:Gluconokinase n=1 Tax=Candidatus Erwinia haradaeae TaxID=1922217 RepID=A0A451DIR6_9GAMM|nr:gluconokinase [Candidatus Erwinia haradaeae]VFP86585.1 Thermoresistant gluconokinase [Candidatus Erwinia haradaeae]